MCIMEIGIAASIAGTAISAMGQIQAGRAAQSQANYQAAVNRNNAIIAERMATDARKRGVAAVDEHNRKVAALMGRQTAVMGAAGLDLTGGSPLDILGDTAQLGRLDAMTISNNFEREALGHEAQRSNFSAEAELATMKGKSAKTASLFGAAGTIAGGIGSVAQGWYKTTGSTFSGNTFGGGSGGTGQFEWG
jgi:flagellar motor component MotA